MTRAQGGAEGRPGGARPAVRARLILAAGLIWLVAGGAQAETQPPAWVEASANTRSVSLGQPFRLRLTAGAKYGWVRLPGRGLALAGCEITGYRETDVSVQHEGYAARQGIYEAVAFSLEPIGVPPLAVEVRWVNGNTGTIYSRPFEIQARSLHPAEGLALVDPRPPWQAPGWFVSEICAAVLLALGGGWVWTRRDRWRKPEKPLEPSEEADKRLARLRQAVAEEAYPLSEGWRELSNILRTYSGRRWNFSAREMARDRLLERLEEKRLEDGNQKSLAEILAAADAVKFAKKPVRPGEFEKALQQAADFIRQTSEESGKMP